MNEQYDSITQDTLPHKNRVKNIMFELIKQIQKRAITHDNSKMETPELEMYNKYIPMLKKVEYGSEDYFAIRKEMSENGLQHHFENNRHHPEHYESGIKDMNIVDFVEMYADWKAQSINSDVSFEDGLSVNQGRYDIPNNDILLWVMHNTLISDELIELNNVSMDDITDGCHTFEELYHQRAILFATICNQNPIIAWKSKKHHDNTMFDGDYFIVGINTPDGQYTYHYKIEYWDKFKVQELENAPEFDGHTDKDVERLFSLYEKH